MPKQIVGSVYWIEITHKSPNAIENIRPGFLLDSLVVREIPGSG